MPVDFMSYSQKERIQLMIKVPCRIRGERSVLPGDDSCYQARVRENARYFEVGGGENTIPLCDEGFAAVCRKCPALITAVQTLFK